LGAELAVLRARTSDDQQITELRELEKKLQLLANNREIESLQARENFEPFVANAPVLREEISKLEGLLAQNYDDVSLMRVDQTAMVPTKPIKPRKSLIVAAAVVSGGMLGVLIALIRNAAAARRERLVEE
ncbi:MAG: GNVR domain-containing protein, partial [Halieaceae bacterium]